RRTLRILSGVLRLQGLADPGGPWGRPLTAPVSLSRRRSAYPACRPADFECFAAIVVAPAKSCQGESPLAARPLARSGTNPGQFCLHLRLPASATKFLGRRGSAHRSLHEHDDPCLFGGGQLLQREGGRPHAAFVEVRLVAEAESRVPRFELLRALEEA